VPALEGDAGDEGRAALCADPGQELIARRELGACVRGRSWQGPVPRRRPAAASGPIRSFGAFTRVRITRGEPENIQMSATPDAEPFRGAP
jgi:hypothetical protein